VDHIVPQASAGGEELEGLAPCCKSCSIGKSDQISGVDPEAKETVLFNPHQDAWNGHFDFDAGTFQLLGRNADRRVTIERLRIIRRIQHVHQVASEIDLTAIDSTSRSLFRGGTLHR
jgi:hypothetical protein